MPLGKEDTTYLGSLIKLQKRAVRLILSAQRFAYTQPLFRKLKLLKLSDIYLLNIMIFIFKFKHSLLPVVFNDMFVLNRDIHHHFTRQSDMYHCPPWKIKMKMRQNPVVIKDRLFGTNWQNILIITVPS